MKSKRQTVWLVSMLSLMVVLSAYYLFTEDAPNTKQVTEGQQVTSMDQDKTPNTAKGDELLDGSDVILNEITAQDGQDVAVVDEKESGDSAVLPDQNTSESNQSAGAADSNEPSADTASGNAESNKGSSDEDKAMSDEDVLKQLEAQGTSASDNLTAYQFQRSEENSRKTDELIKKINEDPSLDQAVMAQAELNALEEKEEKIFNIEEQLQQKYANAAVTENGDDSYKIVVVSEKLEAKEAVSIMDLVIKELGVTQDKVQVQYVTQ